MEPKVRRQYLFLDGSVRIKDKMKLHRPIREVRRTGIVSTCGINGGRHPAAKKVFFFATGVFDERTHFGRAGRVPWCDARKLHSQRKSHEDAQVLGGRNATQGVWSLEGLAVVEAAQRVAALAAPAGPARGAACCTPGRTSRPARAATRCTRTSGAEPLVFAALSR